MTVDRNCIALFACMALSFSCAGSDSQRTSADSGTADLDSAAVRSAQPLIDSVGIAVALLIERVLDPDVQQQALWGLEALGCRAVPAIVHRLDDRRGLAGSGLSLVNRSPAAFEGMRHYEPYLMVDALAAILNQVTGRSFGFIYNGATDEERTSTVQGWRDYLRQVGPEGVCPSGA